MDFIILYHISDLVWIFRALNYSDDEQTVTCHADGLKKLCDDSTVSAGDCIALAPWDFSILYAD